MFCVSRSGGGEGMEVGDMVRFYPGSNLGIVPGDDVGILLEVIDEQCGWEGVMWCRVWGGGEVGVFYVPCEGNPL